MKGHIKLVSILLMVMAFASVATAANPAITGWNNITGGSLDITVNESDGIYFNATADQTINITWHWLVDGVNPSANDFLEMSWGGDGTHDVTVYATNATNQSNQVNWSITVNDVTPDQVLNLTKGTVTAYTVYLSWDPVSPSPTGYRVYTYYANGSLLKSDGGISNTYYNVTSLTPSTTYMFNVSAYDDDSEGAKSNSVSETTASAGSSSGTLTITDVANTTTSNSATITWTTNGDSDSLVKYDTDGAPYEHSKNNTDSTKSHSITLTGLTSDTEYFFVVNSTNASDSKQSIEYSFKTQSSGYTTGNRIWEDGMDTTYTWDARSFTGFYYDLDTGEFTETLKITGIEETLDKDAIEYTTTAMYVDFDLGRWDQYKVIGFMAEKYFAGYDKTETDDEITDETISLVSSGMLSKVLIDEDKKHTISTGASLQLEEGYELKIIQLDVNGNKAQIELTKDGKSISGGTGIIDAPDTFVYTKDIGSVDDVPVIAIYVDSVFAGTETSMLVINGIFQISESYTSVKSGTSYGEMEITGTSGDTITMENDDEISLEEGETVDLMGDIKFLVADSGTLRFALYEEITEPGTYNIRGTVYNVSNPQPWTHMNFEGFYYNIDDNIGTETLTVNDDDTNIGEGNIVYTTTAESVSFDFSKWDEYKVIGFMAEKYFAGYSGTDDEITDEDINLVSSGMLSKVLIDEDKGRTVSTGASLQLEEGYELKIMQLDVNGNKAQLELIKNGKSISGGTAIVDAPDTFVYTKDLGSVDDVPIVAIYIGSVFAGTETSMITIDGIFQISESYKSVKSGDDYGEMEVTSTSATGITMKNSDSVSLDHGETTMIMGDVGFMTSEGGERYYLFVRRTIGSLDSLAIDISETPIVGEELVITVTSGGDPVEGADVAFDGENLGITDSNGEVTHTPGDAGTFAVTASKENYDSASEDVNILTEDEAEKDALDLAMPEVVDPDEEMIIRVTSDGDAIEGATITWDDEEIGETDDTGSLTYSHEETGTYTVTASKSRYLDASEKITVSIPAAKFELDGISLLTEVAAGKSFTITTNVTNVGDIEGTYRAELVIDDGNGTVINAGSQNVTLAAGETETAEFTYKIADAGTYTVQIGGESGEIVVTPSESKTALVAVILLILAVLGGIGYVLISSTPEGGWTAEKLIEAIKEKLPGKKGL